MKVIIAGSRSIEDYSSIRHILNETFRRYSMVPSEIVSGKAKRGIDAFGERWAYENGIPVTSFPAAWDDLTAPGAVIKTNKFGKKYNVKAGFDRNQEMAEYGNVLIAIWDGVSSGTGDMVERAKKQGLIVFIYNTSNNELTTWSPQ